MTHRLIVELRHLDFVGAGQFDDLLRAGDTREVGAIADLTAVTLELGEELLGPVDLLLRRRESSLTVGHWSG